MIPLFDALAHPTLDGGWLEQRDVATFDGLVDQLQAAGFLGACAVAIAGIGGFEPSAYIAEANRYPGLIPVAGFDPHARVSVRQQLEDLEALGYKAVKVHPRFTALDPASPMLREIFIEAARLKISVLYCTYAHDALVRYPESDPFFSLVAALKAAPDARVVLVHGGDVQLLRYAELVRFNPNLLLDLSMTIQKYEGSSIDADIRFLFHGFDQRICIGSDHPEASHEGLRHRFEELSRGLPTDKAERIGFRNLLQFLGREDLAG